MRTFAQTTSSFARGRAHRWLMLGASLGTSVLLLAGSATAFAADDHKSRGEAEGHARMQSVVQTQDAQQDRDNDNERDDNRPRVFNVTAVVTALNNQVSQLSTVAATGTDDENDDEDEITTQPVAGVTTMSLARLMTSLSATDAATLTAAVNANTAALRAFLNGGTPAANAILAALNAAGISPASVLAILPAGDGQLLVLLA